MSDLLNSASLVMIPSGYKEDTVFSAIPTDGSGDLSFTRASNGTRVNSAGLVEVCPWNLFQSSETFNLSPWATNAGATITNTTQIAPNGTATADILSASTSSSSGFYQIVTGNVVGQVYTASLYVKNDSGATSIKYQEENCGAGILFNAVTGAITGTYGTVVSSSVENAGNGWYKIQFAYTSTNATNIFVIYSMLTSANSFVLWGAQLNIGSTAKPYFPTTDRLNVPRLTYQNGGGGCPSLLLEKQSTNLVTYSEDLTQSDWLKQQTTISANSTTSPDGTQNADKLIVNNGVAGGYVYQLKSTTSGTVYTGSFYIKAGGVNYTKFYTNISGSYNEAVINLITGAITNSDFAITPTTQNVGNGWYRVNYTVTSGGGQVVVYVDGGSTSTGGGYTGNGVDGVYIWGAQAEASSYATSYIGPTTSASATRVADACFKTGISSLIGQTEGVIYIDVLASGQNVAGTNYAFFYLFGDASNNLQLFYISGVLYIYVVVSSSVIINSSTSQTIALNTRYKMAVAYKSGQYALYVNGVQIYTSTASGVPTMSQFNLSGTSLGAFAAETENKYNELVLFPTRLTNAELASLTTI